MAWPKIIEIGGIRIPVDSWAEVKEAIGELGSDLVVSEMPSFSQPRREENGSAQAMSHGERQLLIQFIEAGERGMLTQQIGQALGKQGKGVRPALERWSRKIGLVTEEQATAFEQIKRFDGRGFRMTDHYRRTGSSMIGR